MRFRIMASRHSAFYSPLLSAIRFLREEGHEAAYSVLKPGQRSYALLRDGEVDIIQSAVSSNWQARERGVEPLPVHFAQINQRDGFFLVGRAPQSAFDWRELEGRTLLADHGGQPLAMLKYAVRYNGADWSKIRVKDAGSPEKMEAAFAAGTGDFVHLQAPIQSGEIVASVGAAMPPVAFSSLCCAREFQKTPEYRAFLNDYTRAKEWVRASPPEEVAAAESEFFPNAGQGRLIEAIQRYQALGCWDGGIEIPQDQYDQALNVFQSANAITWRHKYEEVVG
jgi:NitT/TauT family transport system substrate-binding protein